MMVKRSDANPLISPASVVPTREDVEIYCTINPAATWLSSGEALLLVRVGERPLPVEGTAAALVFDYASGKTEVRRYRLDDPKVDIQDGRTFHYEGRRLLTSLSHLRIARSRDLRSWRLDPQPAIAPTTEWEAYGCEDARITPLEGRYYITYTAVSHLGINAMLAVTDDFVRFEKLGIIIPTYNKDVCIFPERIGGRYVCRHRPYRSEFNEPNIWTAWSPDLKHWGDHSVLHRPVHGTWQSERVGAGAPPIRTEAGWLEIFHGSDPAGRYGLAAMLSELDHPERLIGYSEPVLQPQELYETAGIYGQCVFSNGLLTHSDGRLTIFYGGADTIVAAAQTTVQEMVNAVKEANRR
jgi:predicted GH43/DUF377 family glycosyl hydrolase